MGKFHKLKGIITALFILTALALPMSCVLSPSEGGPQVIIRYSGETAAQLEGNQPGTGNVFLILTLKMENHGYSSFSTNADRFYVTVNHISYDPVFISYPGQLKTFGLPDGQSATGKVAFEVPETVPAWGYEPGYAAFIERINIRWIKE